MYFFQHDAGEPEARAMYDCIMSGDIVTGAKLKDFREALEERFGFPRVELCSSGTSALHLTLDALGIGPGDEVIVTPFVGVWTVNPILMVGATPVFADIDRDTYNLDPDAVQACVTDRTKAVMPVSVNGVPCDYFGLREAVPDHVRIICDDIEALGSRRQGVYVGADVGKDISVNGFWVSKQVTTCGGGMVTSGDDEFLTRFEKLTRHGHGLVGDMWEQHFGYNAWLSDPQAAMGLVQLARIEEKQARLDMVWAALDEHFANERRQRCLEGDRDTKFVYIIEIPEGVDKRAYADAMAEKGVPTRPYFNSLLDVPHLQRWAQRANCPVNDEVSTRTIALPFHWKLTQEDVLQISQAHADVLTELA